VVILKAAKIRLHYITTDVQAAPGHGNKACRVRRGTEQSHLTFELDGGE
jgi:hypothetical protein